MPRRYYIRYFKIILLIATYFAAFLLLDEKIFLPLHEWIKEIGYFGAFLAGFLYAYSFTAAPATALIIILAKQQAPLLVGAVAGLGALAGDWLIFTFIRDAFAKEINALSQKRFLLFFHRTPRLVRQTIMPLIGAIIIASPLPDELGVSILATATKISPRWFAIISYALNTAGIFVVIGLGSVL